ncbi:hypothetical protein Acr_00g0075500 [Actinidia rufa]|uniref:GH18 domain-containing protein n=1 Tax=Actinidia rufa TaxID=165716 RepID=A0A7J0DSQ3_9ERIC|nr:hypothetical protein Acr_00g0075500 [Actinidia rufa]
MGNFTTTLHTERPPTKALLSIRGGVSSPDTFATIASTPDNRAAFIKSSIGVARKYDFVGLDVDWEFPPTPQDMSNLAVLFSAWRAAIDMESNASGKPQLLLSAAVYIASNFFLSSTARTYPGDAILKNLDFENPMCYDYRGAWDASVTGAQALLFGKASNISTSHGISTWIQNGVPQEKLVMGMPMYGRTWQLKDPRYHGIGDPVQLNWTRQCRQGRSQKKMSVGSKLYL